MGTSLFIFTAEIGFYLLSRPWLAVPQTYWHCVCYVPLENLVLISHWAVPSGLGFLFATAVHMLPFLRLEKTWSG